MRPHSRCGPPWRTRCVPPPCRWCGRPTSRQRARSRCRWGPRAGGERQVVVAAGEVVPPLLANRHEPAELRQEAPLRGVTVDGEQWHDPAAVASVEREEDLPAVTGLLDPGTLANTRGLQHEHHQARLATGRRGSALNDFAALGAVGGLVAAVELGDQRPVAQHPVRPLGLRGLHNPPAGPVGERDEEVRHELITRHLGKGRAPFGCHRAPRIDPVYEAHAQRIKLRRHRSARPCRASATAAAMGVAVSLSIHAHRPFGFASRNHHPPSGSTAKSIAANRRPSRNNIVRMVQPRSEARQQAAETEPCLHVRPATLLDSR